MNITDFAIAVLVVAVIISLGIASIYKDCKKIAHLESKVEVVREQN